MERPHRERQTRLLPHPGANRHHRIRAAKSRRRSDQAYSYNLSRPDQRIRKEMVATMNTLVRYLILLLLALPCAVFGHQLDEYIEATLVAIEPGDIRLQINLTPGVEIADQVL